MLEIKIFAGLAHLLERQWATILTRRNGGGWKFLLRRWWIYCHV